MYDKRPKTVATFAAFLLLATSSGCAAVLAALDKKDSDSSEGGKDPVRARVASAEEVAEVDDSDGLTAVADADHCQEFAQSTGYIPRGNGSYHPDKSLQENLLSLACHHGYYDQIINHRSPYGVLHQRFDDRNYDHLVGGVITILCVGGNHCSGPVAVGQMGYYAQNTDAEEFAARLETTGADAHIRGVLTRRFRAARELLLRRVEKLDPRRKALYWELPLEVRQGREEHWKRHADLWKRYDELEPMIREAIAKRSVSPALLSRARNLRDEYVNKCVASGRDLDACFQGQLARPLTERIIELAIAAGDPILGYAENSVIERAPDQSSAPMEIYLAQYAAMAEERKRYDEYEKAKNSGVEGTTLANMYGDPPPIKIDAGSAWSVKRRKVDYGSLLESLGSKPEWVSGVVKRVRKKGQLTVITFKDEITKWNEHDCVETNKIDRVENGRVIYRKKCKLKKVRTERRKTPPVTVETRSANGLRPGHLATAVVDARRQGQLVSARVSDKNKDRAVLRGIAAR